MYDLNENIFFQYVLLEKIANFRSKNWIFFTRQALAKIVLVLQSTYTGANPCQLWFDWDFSMTGQKALQFEINYSRYSQTFTQMSNLFQRKLY